MSAAYADVLGADDPTGAGVGQRAMISGLVPRIYERIWRPVLAPLLMAGRRDERALALEMLAIGPGDSVLDVGCGPGNFTRAFARASGDGLVVGLDASRTMLEQAVRESNPPNARYVRGDAAALPFPDASFDAVCCFAALYFIEQPLRAIDEIVRVLAPGGRVALLASVVRGPRARGRGGRGGPPRHGNADVRPRRAHARAGRAGSGRRAAARRRPGPVRQRVSVSDTVWR